MYRALEHMTIAVPGGKQQLAPGDVIETFEDWPPWTQHTLVDEKRVRWAPEGITEAERRRAQPLRPAPVAPAVINVVTPEPQASSMAEALEREREQMALQEAASDTDAPVLAEKVGSVGLSPSAPPTGIACSICKRTGFKDATGLKIHVNRAHKGS